MWARGRVGREAEAGSGAERGVRLGMSCWSGGGPRAGARAVGDAGVERHADDGDIGPVRSDSRGRRANVGSAAGRGLFTPSFIGRDSSGPGGRPTGRDAAGTAGKAPGQAWPETPWRGAFAFSDTRPRLDIGLARRGRERLQDGAIGRSGRGQETPRKKGIIGRRPSLVPFLHIPPLGLW
jgi:hypothetical protein